MNAFIYLGGSVSPDGFLDSPKEGDLVIAADAGYRNATRLGIKPDIVVGDFDSYDGKIPEDIEVLRVPAEKDFTDSQLAVDIAQKKGADKLYLIGGLDGRLDHTLSNLAVLEALWQQGIRAILSDGRNRVRYIESTSELVPNVGYRYLSLIAVDKKVKGVSIDGCRYPLSKATLFRNNQYAVSNEMLKNCALVSVRRGGLYIVESRDSV